MRALLLATALLPACTYRNLNGPADLYSPLPVVQNQVDLTGVDLSTLAVMRVGKACQALVLGIWPIGDETASIATAVAKGDIHIARLIETEVEGSLFVRKQCVVVYGTGPAPAAPTPG
jgi:hypothetical protein